MKLLFAAATAAEIQPCLDTLQSRSVAPGVFQCGQWEVTVCITGVGLMAATYSLTRALTGRHYDFVLQAGIGGSFGLQRSLGSVVVVGTEALGDLGAEDHANFIDIFTLGFVQPDEPPFSGGKLVNTMSGIPFPLDLPVVDGLTVHTVSGSAGTIAARLARHTVGVESMEGAALHYVCLQLGVPFLQVRAISNYVTPRDRASWQIGKAIGAINNQLVTWLDAL